MREHLKGMTGVQFLAEELPGLTEAAPIFVIQKLLRSAPDQDPQVRACVVLLCFVADWVALVAPAEWPSRRKH